MGVRSNSTTQALRDLPEAAQMHFPVRQRVSIINTIQRLRCEGYKMKITTDMEKMRVSVIKVCNPSVEAKV